MQLASELLITLEERHLSKMSREALTSFSSSCSTYYDIKPTMIIYIVFEVAMNGLFDINLSIYTYLRSEECLDNLIYVRSDHVIDI